LVAGAATVRCAGAHGDAAAAPAAMGSPPYALWEQNRDKTGIAIPGSSALGSAVALRANLAMMD